MKALTIWQPWASLIMLGVKPYEFRRWPAPRSLIGQRIVVHAAKRSARDEIAELLRAPDRLKGSVTLDPVGLAKAMDLLDAAWTGRIDLPISAGLGTAILGEPKRALDLFRATMDADDINPDMWGWPLGAIEPFASPIPVRGAQGFWEWPTPEKEFRLHA